MAEPVETAAGAFYSLYTLPTASKHQRTSLTNLNLLLKTINVGHFLITALFHLFYSSGQLGNSITSTVGLSSQFRFLVILDENSPLHM